MVFLFSDGLLAQTLKTACVRSAHILLVEFKFHMGYGLLPAHNQQPLPRRGSKFAARVVQRFTPMQHAHNHRLCKLRLREQKFLVLQHAARFQMLGAGKMANRWHGKIS